MILTFNVKLLLNSIKRALLTAAHCVFDENLVLVRPDLFKVYLGDHLLQHKKMSRFSVGAVIPHYAYDYDK